MTIKLTDAAKYYKELPHQRETWDYLQKNTPASVLETFTEQYRNAPEPKLEFSNTWDGVLEAAKEAGAKYPECVAAQWFLESAQGKHTACTHNYFGIKSEDGEGCYVSPRKFMVVRQ